MHPRVLRCCIIDATSSAASLFQNRCIHYQGMQLYTAWLFLPYVVLASFSPAQLQTRKQIVFAPRVCTLVLFIYPSFLPFSLFLSFIQSNSHTDVAGRHFTQTRQEPGTNHTRRVRSRPSCSSSAGHSSSSSAAGSSPWR